MHHIRPSRPLRPVLAALAAGLLSLGAVGVALSDDDGDDDDDRRGGKNGWVQPSPDVPPVTNAAYGEECGSCHLAYQPGLLPARAWQRIMEPAALASHYGDDASLPEATVAELTAYLTANAADRVGGKRADAFATGGPGLDGPGLPRITEGRYFVRKHDEVPARLVKDNPEVGSFSKCNACHRKAAEGFYDESQIDIPGHGPWKD